MMIKVVEEGTARKIKSDYYKIAGKTGTAKIQDPETKKYVNKYRASFAGFFPADNPKYSCVVFVEEPRNGLTHGGSVAAPVFKEISDKVMSVDLDMHEPFNIGEDSITYLASLDFTTSVADYNRLAIQYDLPNDQYGEISYLKTNVQSDGQITVTPLAMANELVPNVTGMSLDEAIFLLENKGIKVRFSGKGKVKEQSVEPGLKIMKNMSIQLQLG